MYELCFTPPKKPIFASLLPGCSATCRYLAVLQHAVIWLFWNMPLPDCPATPLPGCSATCRYLAMLLPGCPATPLPGFSATCRYLAVLQHRYLAVLQHRYLAVLQHEVNWLFCNMKLPGCSAT